MTTLLPTFDVKVADVTDVPILPLWSVFPTHQVGVAPLYPRQPSTQVRPLAYILSGSLGKPSAGGGDGHMTGAGAVLDRRQRVKLVAWSSVWLVVLGSPAMEIWRGLPHPAFGAAANPAGMRG